MRHTHLGTLILVFLSATSGCTVTLPTTPNALAAGSRPNILLIVADDLGYADLGVFGSEIHTPNLDRLARTGTVLTDYHSAPLCAPTRAMLLSGTDHHRAGIGRMGTPVQDAPGYENYLNHRVVSLATRLRTASYHTYMSGKWHLGEEEDQSPTARGFERAFTLLEGGASHFSDQMGVTGGAKAKYRDDGKLIEKLPEDFYSTKYYTDKMIGYFKEHAGDGKPFFAYLAYTAPHWPIQAPDEELARQRGRYDEGYEVLRQRRFEAWKATGFAPKNARLANLPPDYKPWDTLSPAERATSARIMEAYAAMVEYMDREVGRVLKYLEETGQLNSTLVIFQSDNGPEGAQRAGGGANVNNALENIGRRGSWVTIGPGWATASTPFYQLKYSAAEGGIRVPAFVSAPALGVPVGRNDAVLIASDMAPTFLELAGVAMAPARPDALPITGLSFAGLLRSPNTRGANTRGAVDALGWEHSGQAGIRKGDWKLLWEGTDAAPRGAPAAPLTRQRLESGGTAGDPVSAGGSWKLFNLRDDPAERNDVSLQRPEVMAQMLTEWRRYVADNGVIVKKGGAP